MLNNLDTDVLAQKMILEQFVAEAAVAREVRSQEPGGASSVWIDIHVLENVGAAIALC